MANRRMFSMDIVESDRFLDIQLTAQALYFHLGMRADDDGFVSSPKSIMRQLGACEADMKVLLESGLVTAFESGIVVITDWRINNAIRSDRYRPTIHQAEKALWLPNGIPSDNQVTTKCHTNGIPTVYQMTTNGIPVDNQLTTNCQPDDNQRYTQVSIGKDSVGEDSEGEDVKTPRHKYGEFKNVLLTDAQLEKIKAKFPDDWEARIEELSEGIASYGYKYTNFYATLCNWARREEKRKKEREEANGASRNNLEQAAAKYAGISELI